MPRLYNSVADRNVKKIGHAIEQITDEPQNEGRRPMPPLPLAQVLRNVDALHAACNGSHVCNLPASLQRFDLYRNFLIPARVYQRRGQ